MAETKRQELIASIGFTRQITTDEIDSIITIFEQKWNYDIEPSLNEGRLLLFRAEQK